MADYIVKDTELTSVANAIRTAGGTNSLLSFPNGFVSAVGNISDGGSSDFSTATVTGVSDSFSKGAKITGGFIFEDVPGGAPPTLSCEVEIYGGDVVPFALYKGSATVRITSSYTISVSGNITDLENDNLYEITGDCTITIS